MKINRRNFIKTGLAGTLGLALPGVARAQDETKINPYFRPNINYNTLFQGTDWNKLTDEQTRGELMKDALILGRVAEIQYKNPTFLCHHYSTLDVLKVHGFKKQSPDEPDIPQIFFDKGLTQEKIGEFNLPLYYVYVSSPELQSGDFGAHTLVGSPIGNENRGDPRIWDNWRLWEPQNNSVVNIGYNLLPKNSEVSIRSITKFMINSDLFRSTLLCKFNIVNYTPELIEDSVNPNLLFSRPIITNVAEQKPTQFNLKQNSPNPFNASTVIEYDLQKPGNARLDVFNISGQKLETLVNENQSAGKHIVNWKADNYSSGAYFYQLRVGDKIDRKKMIIVR